MNPFPCTHGARIAQLGERQTEDLKVTRSIRVSGTFFFWGWSPLLLFFFLFLFSDQLYHGGRSELEDLAGHEL